MISLSHFFHKFRHLEKTNEQKINEVIDVVYGVCGFKLLSGEVVLEEGKIRLNTSPLKRNEIFLHKEDVLGQLLLRNSSVRNII